MQIHIAPVGLAFAAFERCAPTAVITAYCGRRRELQWPVLHLPIADVITPANLTPCRPAAETDMAAILRWIGASEADTSVLCMCRAGLSRSPALALFVSEALAPGSADGMWRGMKATGHPI